MKQTILLLMSLLVSTLALAQKNTPQQAWKITYEMEMDTLPGVSAEEIERFQRFNEEKAAVQFTYLISDQLFYSVWKMKEGKSFHIIINRRDSLVYSYGLMGEKARLMNYAKFMQIQENSEKKPPFAVQKISEGSQMILGEPTQQFKYKFVADKDTVVTKDWRTTTIPDWYFKAKGLAKIPGVSLKMVLKGGHLKIVKSAVKLERVSVSESDFLPPENFQIVEPEKERLEQEAKDLREEKRQQQATILLEKLKAKPNLVELEKASIFQMGFARVQRGEENWYINRTGDFVFNQIINSFEPIDSIWPTRPGWVHIERNEKVRHFIVRKKEKYGLINVQGEWLLPPEFDEIRLMHDRRLAITKSGKTGFADTWGKIILPPKFDEVNVMGDHYFDVRQGDKWGIYSRDKQKLIIPYEYDGFDFCGGCGGNPTYAYASKNGKWGVLSFDGKVLVPFKFEHPGHYGMRSGNWVTSFEKDGQDVVISIKADKVYSSVEYESMRIISGILALKKNGKIGFVGKDGRQLTPFKYDDISDPYGNFSWGPYINVYINGKEGIVRNDGKVMIPADTYDDIWVMDNYFAVAKDGKTGLLDQTGQQVLPLVYDDVDGSNGFKGQSKSDETIRLFKITKDSLVGVFSPENGVLIKPQYDRLGFPVTSDSSRVYIEVSRAWGEDYYEVYKGLHSLSGEELMPAIYDDYYFITPELLRVENGDLHGVYDLKQQKMVLPVAYNYISILGQGYLSLTKITDTETQEWIWNQSTQKIMDLPYSEIEHTLSDHLIIVGNADKEYLYDLNEKKLISKGYDDLDYLMNKEFDYALIEAYDNGKFGYLDLQGNRVVPLKYDAVKISSEGTLRLSQKIGEHTWQDQFADSLGRVISQRVFKRSYYDYNQYASFQVGNFILITDLDEATQSTNFGIMNLSGEIIVPPKYDKIIALKTGKGFIVEQGNQFGVFNAKGQELLSVILDNVYFKANRRYVNMGLAMSEFPLLCALNGNYFYLTEEGELLPILAEERMRFREFWRR